MSLPPYRYKATASADILILGCCPDCGRMTLWHQPVTASALSWKRQELALLSSVRDTVKRDAHQKAENKLAKKIEKIIAAADKRHYSVSPLSCKCGRCHKELFWAKSPVTKVTTLTKVLKAIVCLAAALLLIGLIAPLKALVSGNLLSGKLIFPGVCAAVIAAIYLFRSILDRRWHKSISGYESRFYPVFASTPGNLKRKAQSAFGEVGEEIFRQ